MVVHENEAFLMPGRGGYHLGIEPEIFRFSQNKWTEVASYDGWAKAGGYGSWKYNDLIYLVGGINGSGSPTEEVEAHSVRVVHKQRDTLGTD